MVTGRSAAAGAHRGLDMQQIPIGMAALAAGVSACSGRPARGRSCHHEHAKAERAAEARALQRKAATSGASRQGGSGRRTGSARGVAGRFTIGGVRFLPASHEGTKR